MYTNLSDLLTWWTIVVFCIFRVKTISCKTYKNGCFLVILTQIYYSHFLLWFCCVVSFVLVNTNRSYELFTQRSMAQNKVYDLFWGYNPTRFLTKDPKVQKWVFLFFGAWRVYCWFDFDEVFFHQFLDRKITFRKILCIIM